MWAEQQRGARSHKDAYQQERAFCRHVCYHPSSSLLPSGSLSWCVSCKESGTQPVKTQAHGFGGKKYILYCWG